MVRRKRKEGRIPRSKITVKYGEEFRFHSKYSTLRNHGQFLNKEMICLDLNSLFKEKILDAM